MDLAERIITTTGNNTVPLPAVLEATNPLNGALDKFDHSESTLAGTGSTHDTILVLFQNVPINLEKPSEESEISARPLATQSRTTVKFRSKVSCKQLIRMETVKDISPDPSPTTDSSATATDFTKSINLDYFLWIVNRFSKRATHDIDNVPGFTAVRNATVNCNFILPSKYLLPSFPIQLQHTIQTSPR